MCYSVCRVAQRGKRGGGNASWNNNAVVDCALFYAGWVGAERIIFSVDVVSSACYVKVDADSIGNSGRLTFGTYRKSTGASVPPRDITVRLYEAGATVQGCSAFKAGQVATLD